MEEILSSIKRIIAEEGEAPGRGRRASPRQSSAAAAAVDEVLELSDPMPATPAAAELTRRAQAIEAARQAAPAPAADLPDAAPTAEPLPTPEEPPMRSRAAATPAPAPAEPAAPEAPIVSARTADASRGALDSLSKLVVKPEAGGDGTLEGLVREMLRPMLAEWLDKNLPAMVETMVAREIARITQSKD